MTSVAAEKSVEEAVVPELAQVVKAMKTDAHLEGIRLMFSQA